METKYVLGFLAAIIVIVGAITFFVSGSAPSVLAAKYDMVKFAQCLKANGAKFYGAYWCPHCAATKKLFGPDAVKELPYIECSTPDGQGQLPICKSAQIPSYPTWEFKDGSRIGGELSPYIDHADEGKITLEDLANAAQCPIIPLDGSAAIEPKAPTTATSTAATATSTATTSASKSSSKAR